MLTRKTLATAVAAVVLAIGTAAVTVNVTAKETAVPAQVTGVDAWQLVHDTACQNGAVNCGPDVTTTTTGVPSSTTSVTTAPTSTTVAPTTTVQPSTTTVPATTTSTTVAPTTSTTQPTTTTSARPTGQPDASNTGVPAGTVLTNYTGSCSIPAGTTIDSKTINCSTLSTGTNVTITRSKIIGNAFSVIRPGSGFKMTDVELTCGRADGSYGINGGNGATYTRLNVHLCENAIEPGNDVILQDSWIHDMEAQSAGHNDGVSIDGAHSNVKILRNNINMNQRSGCSGCGTPTSAIMVDNWPSGSLTGIVIDGNWVTGGQFVQYFDTQFSSGTINATLTNNKFGQGNFGLCNKSNTKVTLSQSGNTPQSAPC